MWCFLVDEVNGETSKDVQMPFSNSSNRLSIERFRTPLYLVITTTKEISTALQLMALLKICRIQYPTAGPDDVDGVGNYIVEVMGRSSTHHSALTIISPRHTFIFAR